MDKALASQINQKLNELDRASSSLANLSVRESQIVMMASVGMSDRDIATYLEISSGTLGTYWARIRQKTGFRKRTEVLAAFWRRRSFEEATEVDETPDLSERFTPSIAQHPLLRKLGLPVAVWSAEGDLMESNQKFRELIGMGGTDADKHVARGRVLNVNATQEEGKFRPCRITRLDGSTAEALESRFSIGDNQREVSVFVRDGA
ncbi:MAG: response regulator transcription factor [Fimbriimonadaceae bacterium]